MIREYISAAMAKADYKIYPEDGTFYGEIPGFQGVYSVGDTLEECVRVLEEVLEEWLLLGIVLQDDLPVMDGMDINVTATA